MNPDILNVFAPGLRRGAAKLAYMPEKRYFYVESSPSSAQDPKESWRVYMRAAVFLYLEGDDTNPKRFLVVKKAGKSASSPNWEPPKGQMEGRDGLPRGTPLLKLMANNVHREVLEEAKIPKISKLQYTGLVFQAREKDYPEGHYFQYHIFTAIVKPADLMAGADKLAWYKEHPAAFSRLEGVKREKDELAWFDPKKTKLMGRWAPGIVALYLSWATDRK